MPHIVTHTILSHGVVRCMKFVRVYISTVRAVVR